MRVTTNFFMLKAVFHVTYKCHIEMIRRIFSMSSAIRITSVSAKSSSIGCEFAPWRTVSELTCYSRQLGVVKVMLLYRVAIV